MVKNQQQHWWERPHLPATPKATSGCCFKNKQNDWWELLVLWTQEANSLFFCNSVYGPKLDYTLTGRSFNMSKAEAEGSILDRHNEQTWFSYILLNVTVLGAVWEYGIWSGNVNTYKVDQSQLSWSVLQQSKVASGKIPRTPWRSYIQVTTSPPWTPGGVQLCSVLVFSLGVLQSVKVSSTVPLTKHCDYKLLIQMEVSIKPKEKLEIVFLRTCSSSYRCFPTFGSPRCCAVANGAFTCKRGVTSVTLTLTHITAVHRCTNVVQADLHLCHVLQSFSTNTAVTVL